MLEKSENFNILRPILFELCKKTTGGGGCCVENYGLLIYIFRYPLDLMKDVFKSE